MNARFARRVLALGACIACASPAVAQEAMQGMDMSMPMPAHREHTQHKQSTKTSKASTAKKTPVAQPMSMPMPPVQKITAPVDGRSPDYSDGYRYGPMIGMTMHDDPALGMLLLDRLEYMHARDGGNATAIDGEAWYGPNLDKLWLKFEGDRAEGRWQDLRTEALWAHAVAPFWNTQLGVRHDSGLGPARTWAALGIEGLAPYWFETQATFYVGQGGRTAARVAFEYEARFTQRLILQPSLELNLYGRGDPRRGIGSGLSDLQAGLRLRYEIRRQFAPYVGVVWQQRFGRSRDYARALGEPAADLQFVAGVRVWL